MIYCGNRDHGYGRSIISQLLIKFIYVIMGGGGVTEQSDEIS